MDRYTLSTNPHSWTNIHELTVYNNVMLLLYSDTQFIGQNTVRLAFTYGHKTILLTVKLQETQLLLTSRAQHHG